MRKGNKKSTLVAVLETIGFFAVITGVIVAAVYFGVGGSPAKVEPKDGYKSVDMSDLDNYEYYTPLPGEKPNPERAAKNSIPDSVQKLNGARVTISGFMMPVSVDDNGNVTEFALNGNYDRCFYGVPSQINQWVHVRMQPGQYAKFSHSPVTVSGTLEVGELVEDGEVISLYRLAGDKASARQRRFF